MDPGRDNRDISTCYLTWVKSFECGKRVLWSFLCGWVVSGVGCTLIGLLGSKFGGVIEFLVGCGGAVQFGKWVVFASVVY